MVSQSTINDLNESIQKLVQQKNKLVIDKKGYELEVSVLKNKIRSGGRMTDSKYNELCDQQNALKNTLFSIERAMNDLTNEIQNKNSLLDRLKNQIKTGGDTNIKKELINLKNHYISFSADRSRVSSMRAMGSEFAEKLEGLIKLL